MPALTQIRFNAACLLRDLARQEWRKIPFHWHGLKRAAVQYARFVLDADLNTPLRQTKRQ